MAENGWLGLLAVLGPLIGAAVGALWATFSPRSTQQRLKEAIEIDKEIPPEYAAEWRIHIDYLVANEAFNDRLLWPGPVFIALGYATTALALAMNGTVAAIFLIVGVGLTALGAYRALAIYSFLRKERKRLLQAFPRTRETAIAESRDGTSE